MGRTQRDGLRFRPRDRRRVTATVPAPGECCRFCGQAETVPVPAGTLPRRLQHCPRCQIVTVDPAQHPTIEEARARYLQHNNRADDPRYVAFLERALLPALPHLAPGARCLDYGCGHTPVLSGLLRARGFACADFDPLFFPDLPAGTFDAVFATEVIEHFRDPRAEFLHLCETVSPGGLLVLMTECWHDLQQFADNWYYTLDPTHICFWHRKTINHSPSPLAVQHHASRVIIARKEGAKEGAILTH